MPTYTTKLNLAKPVVGADDDAWGGMLNGNADIIDGLAPLNNPVFTGNPQAPTAAQGDNDTTIATTAFVASAMGAVPGGAVVASTPPTSNPGALWWDNISGQLYIRYDDGSGPAQWVTATSLAGLANAAAKSDIPLATATVPLMNGTAAVGTDTTWAKGNHVHPVDTSRAAASALAGYLPLTGGNMTGILNSTSTGNFSVVTSANQIYSGTSAAAGAISIQGPPNSYRQLVYYTTDAGHPRWSITCDAAGETGSNAGSNLSITAWADGGGGLGDALSIQRASRAITASASFTAQAGYLTRQGSNGATANLFNIAWVPTANLWIDTTNVGQFSFVSDYRLKKGIKPLASMWDRVKALRPIRYTQRDFTPPVELAKDKDAKPMFHASDTEQWGFVAHELQETLTPSAATGIKDSHDHIQSPNPWTMLATLTKALQEAMARIEALEGAT